jgi:hypothetical protein
MNRPNWQTPWWKWSLYYGAIFGLVQTLLHLRSDRPLPAIIGGLVGGAFFGACMGPMMARQFRRLRRVTGDLSPADQRVVSKAATRGSVPADPALRQAAQRLATYLAERNRKMLWLSLSVFLAFAGLSVFLVLSDNPAWLLSTGLFLGLAVWAAVMPRHYEHRAQLLGRNPLAQ